MVAPQSTTTTLPRRYQRRSTWLIYGSSMSTAFAFGVVLMLAPRSSVGPTTIRMGTEATTLIGLLWLGSGMGTFLNTIIVPQMRATRLIESGMLIMTAALCAWCSVGAHGMLLLDSGSVGIGLTLANAGADRLARQAHLQHVASFAWIGGILGSGFGAMSLVLFSWRVILAGTVIPCLVMIWLALRLPDPPTPLHLPSAWRSAWLPAHLRLQPIIAVLVFGVQMAALTGIALFRPIPIVPHDLLATGFAIACSFAALWGGSWLAGIVTMLWTHNRWWSSSACLGAALCWLLAGTETTLGASLLRCSATFLLGVASQPVAKDEQQHALSAFLVSVVAGGIPWLFHYAGGTRPPTTLIPFFALPIALIAGMLFLTLSTAPTPNGGPLATPQNP